MILQIINREFSIYKAEEVPRDFVQKEFIFVSKTDHELSVICETKYVPDQVLTIEHGWKCFRIAEDAAFSKYGMIAYLADIIAEKKSSTVIVATYDTDYLFIKNEKFDLVINTLKEHGCTFIEGV